MSAEILDGRGLSRAMAKEIKADVAAFSEANGWAPGIAVVQVGEDPASSWYVRQIDRSASRAGINFALHTLDTDAEAEELLTLLRDLNDDSRTNGVIVQMPLPKHLSQSLVTDTLDPAKDVDGITPINAGRLMQQSGN